MSPKKMTMGQKAIGSKEGENSNVEDLRESAYVSKTCSFKDKYDKYDKYTFVESRFFHVDRRFERSGAIGSVVVGLRRLGRGGGACGLRTPGVEGLGAGGLVARAPGLGDEVAGASQGFSVDFGGFWCTGPLVNHDDPYFNPYFNGRKSGGLPDFWDGICGIMWGICQRDGAL